MYCSRLKIFHRNSSFDIFGDAKVQKIKFSFYIEENERKFLISELAKKDFVNAE